MKNSIMRALYRSAIAIVALFGLVAVGVAVPVTAEAAGREPTVRAEIRAQYVHDWDIQPTDEQVDLHANNDLVRDHCAWGVIETSYKLATSIEARNRWNNNSQDLAGMLYAGLLDRAPDPGGLITHTNDIRDRGLEWTVRSVMGSEEYRDRIRRICGDDSVARGAMYTHGAAKDFAWNELMQKSLNLGASCGVMIKVKDIMGIHKNPKDNKAAWVMVAGELTNGLWDEIDGTCAAAVTYVKAAIRIWQIVEEGPGDNPVFIQYDTHHSWLTLRQVKYFTLRVGPDPTHWDKFDGKAYEYNVG